MTLDDYIKNLLGVSYFIDEAVVMGPYVTCGFFKRLSENGGLSRKAYPRSKLTILADDGWDQQQLDSIRNLYGEAGRSKRKINIYRVSPQAKSGLVHAKLYFFTLKNADETYTKRILLLGSANASEQGFGIHAESFINVDLADVSADERGKLNSYIQTLQSGRGASAVKFKIGRGSWVSLPEVKVDSQVLYSGFDAWLRRGRLCHKYQSDASFGRLSIKLENPLPPRELEKPLNDTGFGAETDTQVFSRRYVSEDQEKINGEDRSRWREQYFVETFYGHWTSAECFKDLQSVFIESNADQRRKVIKAISSSAEEDIVAWLDDFQNAISKAAKGIADASQKSLGHFFQVNGGGVNFPYYLERAQKKIQSDKLIASDASFEQRYIAGYSFPRLPQLGDEHEDFAIDWCASVLNKINRRRVGNKFALAIRSLIESENANPQSAVEFLEWMRMNWGAVLFSQRLIYSHRAEEDMENDF